MHGRGDVSIAAAETSIALAVLANLVTIAGRRIGVRVLAAFFSIAAIGLVATRMPH